MAHLGTYEVSLGLCGGSLGTYEVSLGFCGGPLETWGSLGICGGGSLGTCEVSLGFCGGSLGARFHSGFVGAHWKSVSFIRVRWGLTGNLHRLLGNCRAQK